MPSTDLETTIHQVAEWVKNATHAVAFTGAGISTPSGVPDFRSAGSGLWTRDDPMESASLTTFRRHPERFFNWLRPLAKTMNEAQPNPAHQALAALEQAGRLRAVITQNIDGLHQKAGSRQVFELHGSMRSLTCLSCHCGFGFEDFIDAFIAGGIPCCPNCQAILKPDVVLFEEMLPAEAWDQAEMHSRVCDLMLVVGSSLTVTPANRLPLDALEAGARVVLLTKSATFIDGYAAARLPVDVVETLPRIAALAV